MEQWHEIFGNEIDAVDVALMALADNVHSTDELARWLKGQFIELYPDDKLPEPIEFETWAEDIEREGSSK